MPYKDKNKQREAIRIAAAKLRAKKKGIIYEVKPTEICGNCLELEKTLETSEKQRTKLQIFFDQETGKRRKKWRVQKKRLAKAQ
jgi:hypothetical protein